MSPAAFLSLLLLCLKSSPDAFSAQHSLRRRRGTPLQTYVKPESFRGEQWPVNECHCSLRSSTLIRVELLRDRWRSLPCRTYAAFYVSGALIEHVLAFFSPLRISPRQQRRHLQASQIRMRIWLSRKGGVLQLRKLVLSQSQLNVASICKRGAPAACVANV